MRGSKTNELVLVGRKGLFSSKMGEKAKNDIYVKKYRENLISYFKREKSNLWFLKLFLIMYVKAYLCYFFLFLNKNN